MVKTVRIALRLTEEESKRFDQLSKNTGLRKSLLLNLMLGGTLRDFRNGTGSESARLISAWCSKNYTAIVDGIYVY